MNIFNDTKIIDYTWTDLGNNSIVLKNKLQNITNSTLVDLGVRGGVSSMIMLYQSIDRNNRVFGVDIEKQIDDDLINHPKYTFIYQDSITASKNWNSGKIDVLFVDTLHIKEQVLLELKHWLPHVKDQGLIVFHDTCWPPDKKDFYANSYWDRPDDGVKEFFILKEMNYEDEFIKVETYPESWDMTFVQLKNKNPEFGTNTNWEKVMTFPYFIKE
jgi:predicted O-methyltransferase YrrM